MTVSVANSVTVIILSYCYCTVITVNTAIMIPYNNNNIMSSVTVTAYYDRCRALPTLSSQSRTWSCRVSPTPPPQRLSPFNPTLPSLRCTFDCYDIVGVLS